MSMKVYNAYRVKPHIAKDSAKLWQWLRETQSQGEANVKKVMRNLYVDLMDAVLPNSEEYKELIDLGYDDHTARLHLAHQLFYDGLKKNASMAERNTFNFDVYVVIHELDGNLYVRTFCDTLCRRVLDFMARDKRIVEFSYWNNADEPRGMTQRRWKARGAIWSRVDDHITEHLSLTISDLSKFIRLDPWLDLSHEYSRAKKRLAAKEVTDGRNK